MVPRAGSRRRLTGESSYCIGGALCRFIYLTNDVYDRRLASILKKRSLSPQKLDEVKIKANILSAFKIVEEKAEAIVEQASEKLEEAIGRATAEL